MQDRCAVRGENVRPDNIRIRFTQMRGAHHVHGGESSVPQTQAQQAMPRCVRAMSANHMAEETLSAQTRGCAASKDSEDARGPDDDEACSSPKANRLHREEKEYRENDIRAAHHKEVIVKKIVRHAHAAGTTPRCVACTIAARNV